MADTPTPDETWLNRVEALLAKAESTDSEAEAETFFAKAQQLMAKHAIDDVMLAQRRGSIEVIEQEVINIPAPYAGAKAALLSNVARANGCRAVVANGGKGSQRCVVVGHSSDLAATRTMYAALSVHALRAMLAAPVPSFDTPRRFRHAFLLSFAFRIGERLEEARDRAHEEAAAATAGVGLVLVDRKAQVESALAQAFPNLRTRSVSSSSAGGAQAGRTAANGAGINRGVASGSGRALTG